MKPQRIKLSRRAGFNLQAESIALNGLPAVFCARPSRWGNPYTVKEFGLDLALELFARTVRGLWTPDGIPDGLISKAYRLHGEFTKRHGSIPLENARSELRGQNLACHCNLENGCHTEILITIANA